MTLTLVVPKRACNINASNDGVMRCEATSAHERPLTEEMDAKWTPEGCAENYLGGGPWSRSMRASRSPLRRSNSKITEAALRPAGR